MRKLCFLFLLLFLFPSICHASGNLTNESFSKAKKTLEREVYFDHRETVYCGARFDEKKNILLPEGFSTPSHAGRSSRLEWEHAVPAENFGRAFVEWREGNPSCVDNRGEAFKGRNCARKMNRTFRLMEADMHNLFPSIGSVNAVRSNKRYAMLPNSVQRFGSCGAKVSGKGFEPPDSAKGALARAALYMENEYQSYNLGGPQKKLFMAWDKMFPVDKWECERQRRIEKLQGNSNDIVKNKCEKAGL